MPVKNYKHSSKMNTNPDDQTLFLWLEDELAASEQLLVDAWAATQPDWLERRDSSRRWRDEARRIMSSSGEIPSGELFQARLMRRLEMSVTTADSPVDSISLWRRWMLPFSIAAAMIIGFLSGSQWGEGPSRAKTLVTYTPEEGVKAEFFEKSPAEGTVIVLNGVDSLPDEFVNTSPSAASAPGSPPWNEDHKKEGTLVAP